MNIAANLARIRSEIAIAENQYGYPRGAVTLLAVSKTHPVEDIQEAIGGGQIHFGENYCQEAVKKIKAINNPEICWHFIGPIQSNKAKLIANYFDWVHTIDRIKIARRLHEMRPRNKPPLNICIQINISGEESKSGISAIETDHFIEELSQFTRLKIRGLMALPAPSNEFNEQRNSFAKIKRLKNRFPALDTLSIGTTGDIRAAIAEGSTLVRIGTAIFGPRNAKA